MSDALDASQSRSVCQDHDSLRTRKPNVTSWTVHPAYQGDAIITLAMQHGYIRRDVVTMSHAYLTWCIVKCGSRDAASVTMPACTQCMKMIAIIARTAAVQLER